MMNLPAVHFYDPVFALDAHIVLLPTPAGPVPQCVPLVFMGVLIDLMDYTPPDFIKVRVNGWPHAHAGTAGLGNHVPMLGKFVRTPSEKAEVMLGSSTVLTDKKPMAYGPLPVLTCHDVGRAAGPGSARAMMLPSPMSFVMPLPHPRAQVYVGGTPTPSGVAVLKQLKSPAVRRLCKTLRKTKRGESAASLLAYVDKKWWMLEKGSDFTAPR